MVKKLRQKLNRATIEDMVCENLHTPENFADEIISAAESGIDKVFAIVPECEVKNRVRKKAKRDFLSRVLRQFISKLQEILNVK